MGRYDFGATTSLPPCGPPNCNFPVPLSDEVVSYGSWNGSSCVSLPYLWDRGCDYVVTDASGAKVSETRYTYNVQGHATETSAWINGSAYLNSFASYSSNGTLSSATDVNGAITQYHYSGTGACSNLLLTSTTYAVTSLSNSQTWNCSGVVPTSATDVNGNATQYGYVTQSGAPDPLWRMVSFTDQLGNTTYGTFTAASPTVSAKQESTMLFNNGASGVDVLSTLDSLGRPYLTQIRQAPGSSSFDTATVEYDLNGRLSKMHTPCTAAAASPCTSSLLTVTYDAMTRPSAISDAAGGYVSYSYPPAVGYKDVLVTVGPAPNGENVKKKQLEVDGLGRLISVCEITSATGSGTCGQVTQQPGYWTRYKYDALGRLIGVCQHTTQLASIDCIQSPSSGQQTRMFTYDGFGRVVSESNPESGRMQYFYDQAPATPGADCSTIAPNWAPPYNGDLVKKYDANGNTTCYTYDPLHRVLSMTYSGPNATDNKYFVYDGATVDAQSMSNAKGRLAEAYTATCQTCAKVTDVGFGYSKRGELTDTYELTPHSGKYYYINASYWANGALNVFNGGLTKLPGLPTFTYGIDGEGRTSAVSASSGVNPVLGTSYNGSSQVTSVTFGSNDSAGFTFDSNTGRMTQYKETINGTAMHGDLTWNANGSLESLAITDPFNTNDTQTCSYGYDDLTRLTSANCGSIWAQTFSYDAFGNLSKSGSLQWLPGYNQATNRYRAAAARGGR